jgi:UDP-N-acetylmuramoyl-tripeptide--D-alanyl-D-alanine ligase
MNIALRDVAAALGQPGALPGMVTGPGLITGWSIDSRSIRAGDLFFALRGPHHDGHAYVRAVASQGAAAVVVDRDVAGSKELGPVPAIRVPDVYAALRSLAAWARRRWKGKVVAVTGSAGKTTTKDIIAEMLAVELRTAKSEGNLNNEIGLPLSLLRLADDADVAVVELGMNHAGEIRALAEIARPDVGVVTNVGYAHMENFDSIEGIAAAKRELVESLGPDDVAVLNADDPRVAVMRSGHKGRTITYGFTQAAGVRAPDVYAQDVQLAAGGVRFRVGPVRFKSCLTGRHNVSNILAGVAVAGVFGVAPERLQDRVQTLAPGTMRGERREIRGITIFDDCYNSNPDAVRVMLDVLKDTPACRRIAVLGEMLELGHWAEPLHRGVGDYAVACGVDVLVGIGGAASYILDAAKRKGLGAGAALFFENPVDAGRAIKELAAPGDAILFKGSRGVHVERALREFAGHLDDVSANAASIDVLGEGRR